jgi:hypothetical protein
LALMCTKSENPNLISLAILVLVINHYCIYTYVLYFSSGLKDMVELHISCICLGVGDAP